MIVEIDDDYADAILVSNLASSYVSLSKMLKAPEAWHDDDVEQWKKLVPAMKLVLAWYSTDAEAEIKKAKKRK